MSSAVGLYVGEWGVYTGKDFTSARLYARQKRAVGWPCIGLSWVELGFGKKRNKTYFPACHDKSLSGERRKLKTPTVQPVIF